MVKNNIRSEPLPTPFELIEELPTTSSQRAFIEKSRQTICNILNGCDPRLLLIIGPCSVHDTTAAKEYAVRLRDLSQQVGDTFFLVMRTFFEKSRTSLGWKGMLYDPHLNGSHAIDTGMRWTRQLLLDLADAHVPTAAEFLEPNAAPYFSDLISWGCIGARAAESQVHRQLASGLPMPVGFKNNTGGNMQIAINGCITASIPHTYIGVDEMGSVASMHTEGNCFPHLVLRGSHTAPNHDPESLENAAALLEKNALTSGFLVDCSHGNCQGDHNTQVSVFESVIHQAIEGNNNIRGLLLESHLFSGRQPIKSDGTKLRYAVSLTDSCLDWNTTKRLIQWGYVKLNDHTTARSHQIHRLHETSPLSR
ncbi:MAG: 3-deoxy-7-phosphoheptulonate synthase [Chlamydiales bacterium]|nr:3-deoxy-7-phosphoheptulonate synthase [Chlamydiia bacterium]MCP5506722.1 3-deoxy-7-phosphoheptulonate synthase [Chlamydiales bacterium]